MDTNQLESFFWPAADVWRQQSQYGGTNPNSQFDVEISSNPTLTPELERQGFIVIDTNVGEKIVKISTRLQDGFTNMTLVYDGDGFN